MALPWKCPNPACGLTWHTHDGSCPACFYGYTPAMLAQVQGVVASQAAPPLLFGPNGETTRVQAPALPPPPPSRHPDQVPQPPAQPPDAYATLLKGVQQLLAPVVAWLTQHGIQVQHYTEAIPLLLQTVNEWEMRRSETTPPAAHAVAVEVENRLQRVETGLQQLALAVATLQHPAAAAPPVVIPETGYQSFMVTDRDQAQLEQVLLQEGRQREWGGR